MGHDFVCVVHLDMYVPCKGTHIYGLILVQAAQRCCPSLFAVSTLS